MQEEKIKTGADWRLTRLRDMLAYISAKQGATTVDIKGFMGMKYGLKFKTTASYISEMHIAGLITELNFKWVVTKKYKTLRKLIYSE